MIDDIILSNHDINYIYVVNSCKDKVKFTITYHIDGQYFTLESRNIPTYAILKGEVPHTSQDIMVKINVSSGSHEGVLLHTAELHEAQTIFFGIYDGKSMPICKVLDSAVRPIQEIECCKPCVNPCSPCNPCMNPCDCMQQMDPCMNPCDCMQQMDPCMNPCDCMQQMDPCMNPCDCMQQMDPCMNPCDCMQQMDPCMNPCNCMQQMDPCMNPCDCMQQMDPCMNSCDCMQQMDPCMNPCECMQQMEQCMNPCDCMQEMDPSMNPCDYMQQMDPSMNPCSNSNCTNSYLKYYVENQNNQNQSSCMSEYY